MNKLEKKIYMKKYRASHKEEIKEYGKQYRIDNKEKIFERYKRFHLKNPEYNKQYRIKNIDHIKKWADEHKEQKKEYDKIYNQEHIPNRNKEKDKQWRINNKEKILARSKQWREENGKRQKEYAKKYYQEHKKEELERSRKYRRENPEQEKKWKENNPDIIRASSKKYRISDKGKANIQRGHTMRRKRLGKIINTLTSQEWLDILEAYNYRCAYCGVEFEVENMPTRDHIIPISKGGDNTKENVVPACRSCNSKKGAKIIKEKGMLICQKN